LWDKPDQLEGLVEFYKQSIAVSGDFESKKLVRELNAWEARLSSDQEPKVQAVDESGRLLYEDKNGNPVVTSTRGEQEMGANGHSLYLDRNGNTTTEKSSYQGQNKPKYKEVPNPRFLESQKFSSAHISDRVRQVIELQSGLAEHSARLKHQYDASEGLLLNHLWIDEAIWPEVSHSLLEAIEKVDQLLKRVQVLVEGFENLPREELVQLDHPEEIIEGELVEETEGE